MLGLIPPARLFEEVLKLFMSGHAQAVWPLLLDYHLAHWLFPLSVPGRNDATGMQTLIALALRNTDERLAQGKPVTPAFLYAVLLWGPLQQFWQRAQDDGMSPVPALQKAIQQVIQQQAQHTSIPKRFGIPMREMWELQGRLSQRSPKRCEALLQHPRFRAAYDLLLLREEAGELEPGLGDWWTRYQTADEAQRAELCKGLGAGKKKRRRRPRNRRPKPSPES